jgi:hypothetical protein
MGTGDIPKQAPNPYQDFIKLTHERITTDPVRDLSSEEIQAIQDRVNNGAATANDKLYMAILQGKGYMPSSGGRPIIVSDKNYALLKESEILDSKGTIIGTVSNKYGYLDMYVNTKGSEYDGRGVEVFGALFNSALSKGAVLGINGTWSKGALGSNLRAFNRAIQNGMTEEEAAFETFTGSSAKALGYGKVEIHRLEGKKGEYYSVSLTFVKD